jgi:hypothetical protein
MSALFEPPYRGAAEAAGALRSEGYVVLEPRALSQACGVDVGQLAALAPFWERLVLDHYLRDGGRYRQRRHSSYVVGEQRAELQAHRAHFQPEHYNALHGGILRWFEPLEPELGAAPALSGLLCGLGRLFSQVRPAGPWYVEAHAFRIDTAGGIGRPTPEGAHRDGVDFVAVLLVGRRGIKGGETRVFDAAGPRGQRFTLTAPWSALLLDDTRVIHETTPIQPLAEAGQRDTLVLTYRQGGFQDPLPGERTALPS